MSAFHRAIGRAKGRAVRGVGATVARVRRPGRDATYRPGVTVVTVSWNSLPFLRVMLDATRAMSPSDTEILVVDNGSSDGSVEYLRTRNDVRVMRLPTNVGHGVALDLAMAAVDTEYAALLDVDAFPISDRWLDESIAALNAGAQIAGARMHRNFVHPCFLVTRPRLLHEYGLTFRPVGSLAVSKKKAPLFFDVGEALTQRVILKFGGGRAIHYFEITSLRGPGNAGQVFGDLVYHNLWATHGNRRGEALELFREAVDQYHPGIWPEG